MRAAIVIAAACLVAAASASLSRATPMMHPGRRHHHEQQVSSGASDPEIPGLSLALEWTTVDYEWAGSPWGSREAAIAAGAFIPENNIITGLSYHQESGTYFVCVPRWRAGVPSTLNTVVVRGNGSLVLRPWPSWTVNRQIYGYVQSVWIDHNQSSIYVIDTGRQNFFGGVPDQVVNTSAKLHIYKLNSDGSGTETYYHEFSDAIFPYTNSFLNDIVVDTEKEIAYMTDTNVDPMQGALVALNLKTRFAVRFVHASTQSNTSFVAVVNGVAYPGVKSPCDGIALSSDGKHLYYGVVEGTGLFTIPTAVLASPTATYQDRANAVSQLIVKPSFSDGMRVIPMSVNGTEFDAVFFGAIGEDTLYYARIAEDAATGAVSVADVVAVATSQKQMQWMDSFATAPNLGRGDGRCPWLLFTTNRLQMYFVDTMPWDGSQGANMRLFWHQPC